MILPVVLLVTVSYRQTGRLLPTDGGFVTEKRCLSLARARTHYKFLKPCHRFRLAKLFSYQAVVGNNEVARVTRRGDFALKMECFSQRKEIKTGPKTH